MECHAVKQRGAAATVASGQSSYQKLPKLWPGATWCHAISRVGFWNRCHFFHFRWPCHSGRRLVSRSIASEVQSSIVCYP